MRRGVSGLSATEARRIAVRAQGLNRARPRRPVAVRHLRQAIDPIGIVQLDAISVVARTQFVVLFSRVGSYPQPLLHSMAGPGGELFECAGYRAALMPLEYQRLFRWQAAAFAAYQSDGRRGAWWQAYHQANADYIEAVRRDVAERGPLTGVTASRSETAPRRMVGTAQRRPPGPRVPVHPGGTRSVANAELRAGLRPGRPGHSGVGPGPADPEPRRGSARPGAGRGAGAGRRHRR